MAKAKLIGSINGNIIGEFPLEKERVTIGRKSDNDIQINNLAVSGRHAQVVTILDDSFLEDLNSTNGTFVNSKLKRKHALSNGDVISIGRHRFEYVKQEIRTGAAPDRRDSEDTTLIRPGAMNTLGAAADPAMETWSSMRAGGLAGPMEVEEIGSDAPGRAHLEILNGANKGMILPINRTLTTIGVPGVALAAVSQRPQGFFLIHIESGNEAQHPRVNDAPINYQARPLHDQDLIEVAGIKVRFCLNQARPQHTPTQPADRRGRVTTTLLTEEGEG